MLPVGPADAASTHSSRSQYWRSGPDTACVGTRKKSPAIVNMDSARTATRRLRDRKGYELACERGRIYVRPDARSSRNSPPDPRGALSLQA